MPKTTLRDFKVISKNATGTVQYLSRLITDMTRTLWMLPKVVQSWVVEVEH